MALLQVSALAIAILATSAVQCSGTRPVDSGIVMVTEQLSLPNDFDLLGSGPHLERFKTFVTE